MNDRYILAGDGTRINGEAGYSQGNLWLYISGMTMAEGCALALDTGKTGRIEFVYGQMKDRYNGFTRCIMVMRREDGVNIQLQGDNTTVEAGLPLDGETE